jgi:hypothetical protein
LLASVALTASYIRRDEPPGSIRLWPCDTSDASSALASHLDAKMLSQYMCVFFLAR